MGIYAHGKKYNGVRGLLKGMRLAQCQGRGLRAISSAYLVVNIGDAPLDEWDGRIARHHQGPRKVMITAGA